MVNSLVSKGGKVMLLKNADVFIDGAYHKTDIRIENGVIWEIAQQIPGEGMDCSGKKIIPGLVDIHTHGCILYDFSVSTPEEIHKMCAYYAKHGVTSLLATTMTNEDEMYQSAMSKIAAVIREQKEHLNGEAKIMGINMEGPFFGPAKKGAHDEQYLKPVSQALFDDFQKKAEGAIRMVDIDPTLDHAIDFIAGNSKNCVMSIAHTTSTYEQAERAVLAGADHVTHMFNAMNPLLHREPGVIGAASQYGLYVEMICDGIHIHPAVIQMMFRAFSNHIVLISDSINPTGLSDGFYTAGGLGIEMRDRKAFLPDGTLAGSTITLLEAVQNVIRFGVPEEEVVWSATYLPAKSVRCEDRAGSITCGRSADLLILDQDLNLEHVIVEGRFIEEEQ